MKKQFLYLLLFLCFPLSVWAQQGYGITTDSSLNETISHNRRLLLDKFNAGRLDSVSLLLDSFDRHQNIRVLWPAERLLLYYWIERYHAIDSLAQHFGEACNEVSSNHPPDQIVWNVLSYHSLENIDTLVTWVDQTGCSDDIFDFRVQLLETMLYGDQEDQTSINREIQSLADQYFPQEKEPAEVQTVVPKQIETYHPYDDPWRIGFGIGLGPTSVSGNLTDYLSTKASLSFNLNVNYRRWCFILLMQTIFAKLEKDIPVNDGGDIWEAGQWANITNFGLALGYSVFDRKFVRMSPFIGLSVSGCSPSEQQMENNEVLRDAGIRWGFSSMYGVDTEIKLYNMISFLKRKDFLASFNVRLNYIPAMFDNVKSRYSGNVFFVTFGVSMDISTW